VSNNKDQSTLVTATNPCELSTTEAAIMDACNALHEARAAGNESHVELIEEHLALLLRQYDETDGDNHPNPAWARPNQRALVLSARCVLDESIDVEKLALKYADTPRRKEISMGNIADRYLRMGWFDDAVEWFMRAWAVAPHSIPVMMTGVRALCLAGRPHEANAIVESLTEIPELLHEGSELSAFLDYESQLKELADTLPALDELFAKWEETRQSGGAS
jgi:hypothetical protein